MESFDVREIHILEDALDELAKGIRDVRLKRSDIDPERVKDYLEDVKKLHTKVFGTKCKLVDIEIAKSKT